MKDPREKYGHQDENGYWQDNKSAESMVSKHEDEEKEDKGDD
jgi:hypothetical protein